MESYATFLVGDYYFDTWTGKRLVKFFHVMGPIGGRHFLHIDLALTHCTNDLFNILSYGLVAHDVVAGFRSWLVSGHGSVLVFKDDVEDVLSFFDTVRDGSNSPPEKCGITHQRILFVGNKRIH